MDNVGSLQTCDIRECSLRSRGEATKAPLVLRESARLHMRCGEKIAARGFLGTDIVLESKTVVVSAFSVLVRCL